MTELVKEKAKNFLLKNLDHLDELEKEIKMSRKNFRMKYKTFSDKMEGEIQNIRDFSAYPIQQECVSQILELQNFLDTPEAKTDKEDSLKYITRCRSNYKDLLSVESQWKSHY